MAGSVAVMTGRTRRAAKVTASRRWRTAARVRTQSRATVSAASSATVALNVSASAHEPLIARAASSTGRNSSVTAPLLLRTLDLGLQLLELLLCPRALSDERGHHLRQRSAKEGLRVLP